MSLLLDALKKAADDKKKISQGEAAGSVSSETTPSATDSTVNIAAEDVVETADELTLDPVETEVVEEDLSIAPQADEYSSESDQRSNDSSATSYTVSDEALSMLIYKTNRDVKQSRRIGIIGISLASLVVLVAGGVYYYMGMQAEIAALERKHQIAMHSMALKTNKEKSPENSKIIRNLVSESDLNDKVKYAKKHMAEKNNARQVAQRPVGTLKNYNTSSSASSEVSFKKTNKADPVAEGLEQAWLAYEGAQYDRAKKLYKKVSAIEKNNRDALLGLGAIAVLEKETNVARDIYVSLLKIDPRDPIAISALASLRNNAAATETDEKYLQSMLQKNPADAHLNFALGNVFAQQGKWKPAQQSYFNAWQRDNGNADYLFNLAVSMDQLGKQKQAVEFYQDCLTKSANKQVAFSREAVRKRITELSRL